MQTSFYVVYITRTVDLLVVIVFQRLKKKKERFLMMIVLLLLKVGLVITAVGSAGSGPLQSQCTVTADPPSVERYVERVVVSTDQKMVQRT